MYKWVNVSTILQLVMGIPEKIKAIQDEIHKTQINKATEFHIGLLKAKMSRLKREMEENTHGKIVARGGGAAGFDVRKAGDATVVLIGLPSVGKSTLLNRLTNAKSKVASYQFTTLTAVPGLLDYRGSKIQILDMPGIIEGAAAGKGLGHRFLRHIERNPVLLFLIPADCADHKKEFEILVNELEQYNPEMLQKDFVIAISKTDMLDEELKEAIEKELPRNIPHVFISSITRKGLDELKDILRATLSTGVK